MTTDKYGLGRGRLSGLLRLSRWREHVPFTVPATLLGVNMAGRAADGRVLIVTAANILAVAFAFMVNELEDAPDDAREPQRAARNAISCGAITPRAGWEGTVLVAALAAGLFAALRREALAAGVLTLMLGFLYSWRGVRLKALPVIDVVSHALMLSSLLFLTGHLVYDVSPGRAWWAAVGVGLVSAYGQLYNQLRDYDMDRVAGLRNTASILGPRRTQIGMYGCLIGAGLSLGATVFMGLWPLWLAVIPVILMPFLVLKRSRTDMRGTAAIDLSGQWQGRAMLTANVVLVIWLVVTMMA
jgi:4-hydroxybenzoate polyprenyltransferase